MTVCQHQCLLLTVQQTVQQMFCIFLAQLLSIFVQTLQFFIFFTQAQFLLNGLSLPKGVRATSDISSWAHLINKWINYARFMGWCTSKHFKGHAECPWGAIMRGSSTQRQIWWPRFTQTHSFSHFVCICSFLLLCHSVFVASFFPPFFILSWHLISLTFSISPSRFSCIDLFCFCLSWDLGFFPPHFSKFRSLILSFIFTLFLFSRSVEIEKIQRFTLCFNGSYP